MPNNLMPYILGVANHEYPYLRIFADDFETLDGTTVRDYIHIMDLVDLHLKALQDDAQGVNV